MKKKFILVVISSLFSFMAVDYFFYKAIPKPCVTVAPDKLVHHSLVPGKVCRKTTTEFSVEYRVNNLGLRGENFSETKPENEYRILFLGDSFIEGIGVDQAETISQKTEDKIKELNGKKIRAINAGVSAYSPILEYLYLKYRGIKLSPDLVVVNLFMNDFNDDRSYSQKAHYGDSGEVIGVYVELKQHLPSWLTKYLEGRSASYYLFKKYERQLWKTKGKITAWFKHQSPPDYSKSGIEFEPGNPDRDPFAVTRDIPEEVFDDLFEPTVGIILQMKRFLDQRNISMILVIIPSGHQVGDSQWVAGRREIHIGEGEFPDKILTRLAEFSKTNGIYFIDLTWGLKEYLAENPAAKLYHDSDGHFSPLGHKVSADLLADFLRSI